MWVNSANVVTKDKVYSRYDYSLCINISASARLLNMVLVSNLLCYCIIYLIFLSYLYGIMDIQLSIIDCSIYID